MVSLKGEILCNNEQIPNKLICSKLVKFKMCMKVLGSIKYRVCFVFLLQLKSYNREYLCN